MKNAFLFVTLFLVSSVGCFAGIPEGRLFYFERSTNQNVVCYDVIQKDGKLDLKEPVYIYWAKIYNLGKGYDDASWLDKKLAFGYVVDKKGDNEVTGHLAASRKFSIRICQRNGKWIALCRINGKDAILKHLYVKMKSAVSADYVDVYGISVSGGENLKMRIR